ncbi:unnamed protein product [Echinostoma caproni]|uniref:Protein xylosyltransferase n=1 Tax=Echinostoma caproni TaxID=27848 RepID=A0A183AJQ4_9TREM|nr:unnamed protein product [Echinostoma caproni]
MKGICHSHGSPMRQKRVKLVWVIAVTVTLTWILLIRSYLGQSKSVGFKFTWYTCETLLKGENVPELNVHAAFTSNQGQQTCDAITTFNGKIPWVSPDEEAYPIAFAIAVYENPEQFAHFLRLIYRPHNAYCVHIDRKSRSADVQQFEQIAQCFGPNIFLIPPDQRLDVAWGYFSVLETTLICARFLLWNQTIVPDWRYMLNANNKEFPLRTNWELVTALQALNGSNMVESVPCPDLYYRKPNHSYSFSVSPTYLEMDLSCSV